MRQENLQVMDDLEKSYGILSNLLASGIRDYHNLCSAYLTANSILIAAIAIIVKVEVLITNYFSAFFSVVGLIICLQMWIALGRFRAQNTLWERNLRIIESNTHWKRKNFFKELYEYRENQQALPPEGGEPEFMPNFAIKHHRKWWAPRMKGLPWIFTFLYVLLLTWSIINIVN